MGKNTTTKRKIIQPSSSTIGAEGESSQQVATSAVESENSQTVTVSVLSPDFIECKNLKLRPSTAGKFSQETKSNAENDNCHRSIADTDQCEFTEENISLDIQNGISQVHVNPAFTHL